MDGKEPFDKALDFTLKWEGLYSNIKGDPGGPTMRGITQRTYDSWRKAKGLEPMPVRQILDEEVRQIYYERYWLPPRCNEIADICLPLAICVFDWSVNSGVKRAVRYLQKLISAKVDGIVGSETLNKIKGKVQEWGCAALTSKYLNLREDFLNRLVTMRPELLWAKKGWMNRLRDLRSYAILNIGDMDYIRIPPPPHDAAFYRSEAEEDDPSWGIWKCCLEFLKSLLSKGGGKRG